ncbi:PLAC8-domain-containing protein [Whalleya microplaca]|nr:PLAC8-domain-containing protein [Whalleya microplaca]
MDTNEKIVTGPPQLPPQEHPQYSQPQVYPQPQVEYQAPRAQPPMGTQAGGPTAYGQQGGKFQAGLCDCGPCSSCLLGWCLPCILVGQTSERIRDPSMQNADLMNSDCLIHGAINCFTGCGWIYAMLKRGEIRERYQIEGSGCNDCCVSFWCSCCAVIQQDNEVKIRQKNAQPIAEGYQPQPGMQIPEQK